MKVLVTGSDGFIGKNLTLRLEEKNIDFDTFTRRNSDKDLTQLINNCDIIVHLAGENRPKDSSSFEETNSKLTSIICEIVRTQKRKIPIIYSSSTQAKLDNPYGQSKLKGEKAIKQLHKLTGNPKFIFRLPGVFGKWSKPNYNSVVATFCNNVCKDLPIRVDDPTATLTLVHIDNVVDTFLEIINCPTNYKNKCVIKPQYKVKVGALAKQIELFRDSRQSLITEKVGGGFVGKLYSTYLTYIPPEQFSYKIPKHEDERGIFAEILKTKECGQFSFFTAAPNVKRGGHYHHSKTEKFLVVQGYARFHFKHLVTNETWEIEVSNNNLEIVETVPGWAHDIENIGKSELIVLLWANELFDPKNPDTIASELTPALT